MDKKYIVDKIIFTPCKNHSDRIGSYRILSEEKSTEFLCEDCFQKFSKNNDFSFARNQDFTIPQSQRKYSSDGEILFKIFTIDWGTDGENPYVIKKSKKVNEKIKDGIHKLFCAQALILGTDSGYLTWHKNKLSVRIYNNRMICFTALNNPIIEVNENFEAIRYFDFGDDFERYAHFMINTK